MRELQNQEISKYITEIMVLQMESQFFWFKELELEFEPTIGALGKPEGTDDEVLVFAFPIPMLTI